MFRIAFALLTTIQSIAQPAPAVREAEIKEVLARAEALYYAAHFSESIALLTPIDDAFKTQPGRLQDKVDTKLKLALAHIGTNETARALSFLIEMFALNPDYVLDTKQFSPKVVALAAEARTQHSKTRCQRALTDARSYLAAGDSKSFLGVLRPSRSQCTELAELGPEAAEILYKEAVAAYRRSELTDAMTGFETVLSFSPGHELSLQYLDLIKSKQQLDNDRLLVQWQRDFNERRFEAAAQDYRQILSLHDGRSGATAIYVTGEYRKTLTSLVDTWNRGCAVGDAAAINGIRAEISQMLPEPSFGQDIRGRMSDCPKQASVANAVAVRSDAKVESKAAAKPEPDDVLVGGDLAGDTCLEMAAEVALTRLKTRVDPVLTTEVRYLLRSRPRTVVRVKTRISEAGDVSVMGMAVGLPLVNKVVRDAVVKWKFTPIRDGKGPRCVDTELPFVMSLPH